MNGIKVEYGEAGALDDLFVAEAKSVHVEHVGYGAYWVGIETPAGTIHVDIDDRGAYLRDERDMEDV